jgi:hypothetical protein
VTTNTATESVMRHEDWLPVADLLAAEFSEVPPSKILAELGAAIRAAKMLGVAGSEQRDLVETAARYWLMSRHRASSNRARRSEVPRRTQPNIPTGDA